MNRIPGQPFGRRFVLLVVAFLGMLTLIAQLPLSYRFTIGQADGPGSDLPFVQDFNTPERDDYGPFRWTSGASRVRLAGLGSRTLAVTLHSHPINEFMATSGPHEWTLVADGRPLASVPVRQRGGTFRFLVPAVAADDHLLEIRSSTVVPSGDSRALGILLDGVQFRSGAGWRLPALRVVAGWLAALALFWWALRALGWPPRRCLQLGAGLALLAGSAAYRDPLRFAQGTEPALVAMALALALALAFTATRPMLVVLAVVSVMCGLGLATAEVWWSACAMLAGAGLALAAALRPAAMRLWNRLDNSTPQTRRMLVFLVVLVFALRYGGKIFPAAMEGDIGFHVNRFGDTLRGLVFILSKNRGVDFPYPSALYVILAPLTLLAGDRVVLLQMAAAVMDAASPLLVYLVGRRSGLLAGERFAVLAAAFYALCGAGFMPTWWNFSTHIFAQFTHLLLVTAVIVGWNELRVRPRRRLWWAAAALAGLQLLVFLGHFGFWINVTLLACFGLATLTLRLWRDPAQRPLIGVLAASLLSAQVIAVALFYSAFSGLFLAQVQAASSGGLTGVAGRAPVPAPVLWRTLYDGLYAHVGLFPLALALAGMGVGALSGYRRKASALPSARTVTLALMGGSALLGLGFAVLPFVTGSTLSTRWFMFAIWAISIGAAAAAEHVWRRGRAGKLVVALAFAYPAWLSAVMWVGALAWRIRPPEPF